MGPPNYSFQPSSFIHRGLFYRVSEHGSFIAQKVYIRLDILWQLTCSGARQKGHLYKRFKRAAPYVVAGFLVEVLDSDFPWYRCERVLQVLESLFSPDLQSIYWKQYIMSGRLPLPPPGKRHVWRSQGHPRCEISNFQLCRHVLCWLYTCTCIFHRKEAGSSAVRLTDSCIVPWQAVVTTRL
jgi:hypothetical protein